MDTATGSLAKIPWNKGKVVGQKAPLKLKDIWAIRIRLQLGRRTRELALFDLGLDSKLRAADFYRSIKSSHTQRSISPRNDSVTTQTSSQTSSQKQNANIKLAFTYGGSPVSIGCASRI